MSVQLNSHAELVTQKGMGNRRRRREDGVKRTRVPKWKRKAVR